MAAHLERHAGVSAVVNLVPVLLDQLEDYADQFATGALRDPLLRLLARDESTPLTRAERELVIDQCFRANHEKMVQPFPAYKGLHDLYLALERQGRDAIDYLSDRYCHDLLTWYHLAWMGETVKRESELVIRLMAAGHAFTRGRPARAPRARRRDRLRHDRALCAARRRRPDRALDDAALPSARARCSSISARRARRGPRRELPASGVYPGGIDRVRRADRRRAREPRAAIRRGAGGRLAGRRRDLGTARAPPRRAAAADWTASSESVLGHSLAAGDGPVPGRQHDRAWRIGGHRARVLLPRRPAVRPHRVRVREVARRTRRPRTSSASSRRSRRARRRATRRSSA